MFAWVRNRLFRWRVNRRRMIYRYYDGRGWVSADPIRLYLGLQEHPQYNADIHPALVDRGDPEAAKITCEAVQQVFDVRPYDPQSGTGLTLGEQLSLLLDYYLFLEEQKKKVESWPTSPSNTEESTSSPSSETTTPPTSDSGPTGTAPTTDAPTQSA